MAGSYFYKLVFALIFILRVSSSYKLNVPRILLPIFNDFPAQFLLISEGGCYKWTTTRSDIISLTLIDEDPDFCCSSKVVVTSVTKEFARNIAVVLAEDVHTKQVLRCDVIVDTIDNLEIVTTTRELFMEEAPEAFEVRAYDDQGNEFSTLEGIHFDWDIMSMGTDPSVMVLRFMTFSESPYETPHTIQKLEGENKQGHIVLLEGVKTGAAKISVNLPQPEYKHIKPCAVQLSVIANLLILPADAYILVGDTVTFQIILMNNGQMEVIELPDAQFYLEVENQELGSSEKETGAITGLAEGRTRVVLHDRNVNENDPSFKLPAATLNIVAPAYMVLSCMPHRNWAILKSVHHDIIAEVFSSNDNKIYLGSNAQVHTQIGGSFHVQERSQNGSWLTGWATETGIIPVQGLLESVVHPSLGTFMIQKEISAQAQLHVFNPIVLTPSEVVLPWDPQRRPKYQKQIKATGGDGKFLWSSSNHSMGVVTQSGLVRTHTIGYFEVSAAMMRNHHNRETAVFLILPPTRLEIVEFVMEAEIGSIIYLHVALYADKHGKEDTPSQIPFTSCQELPFDVKFSDSSFAQNKSAVIPPVGMSCANVAIIGTKVAIATVTISYTIEDTVLEDTVTISTFKPLKVLKPNVCEIVLAVGTSISVFYEGGPQIIPGKQHLHKRTIEIEDDTVVTASETASEKPDDIVVTVACLKLGKSVVTLIVSNSPSLPNSKTQESSAIVKVVCGQPKSLSLTPETQAANTERCPMDLSSTRVVIHSYKDIELDVIVMDDEGRTFLNISSLKFDWNVNPKELGGVKNSDGVFTKSEIVNKGTVYSETSYQIVSPNSQTGAMEVTAAIVSYKPEDLIAQGASLAQKDLSAEPITAAIHLFLVNDTVVSPTSVSVFNHPGNRKMVAVSQGSGFFEMALSDDNVANVKYIDSTREIEIVPINDGHLRITVIDLCLSSNPSSVDAKIVSVKVIRVEMSDKVEIGRCISCIVKLYDENDNPLCVPDLNMVNVEHYLQRDIAKVKKLKEESNNPWGPGEIHFVITGIELGESKLSFSIGETSSAPIDLQVFSPLKVTPRNTTLVVGSVLQFSNKGGPLPDCNVEYASESIEIADINIAGLVQAKALGYSKITARAVGINPTTGKKVVYSQDTVDLTIVPLTGIKIGAPLMRFQVGNTVPAWATGIPDLITPILLGTVEPPIKFEWKVEENDLIDVHGIFRDHGIEYAPEDDISVRLTGLKPGVTKVLLEATVPGATAGNGGESVTYSTSIDVEVFEKLTVINPNNVVGSFLLMAPHSTVQIQTNLDATNKLTYSISGPDPPLDTDLRKSLTLPNQLVTFSPSGLLQSHGAFGKTMILITALDEYGLKQSLSVIVEVKPVQYMLLNVIANWKVENPPTMKTLPQGVEFQLHVTYHDNIGSQFTSGTAELGIRSSRFDLAKIRAGIDNDTVYVALKKPGTTMIKVWADGYHKTADYVKLRVGSSLSPRSDLLNTGDLVCACTSVVSTTDLKGTWSSSDRNLLSIDPDTGIGQVEGCRSGSVSISHSLHPNSALQLQVVPSNQITMLPDSNEPLINAQDAQPYIIPLVLSNEQNPMKTTNVVCECDCEVEMEENKVFPFTCKLLFSNLNCGTSTDGVFKIEPGFDSKRGQYVCNITTGEVNNPKISTLESNVSVWAELVGGGVQAAPIELPFVPAVFVEPDLYLNEERGILIVYGLDQVLNRVTVEPADSQLMEVEGPDKSKPNVLAYNVHLLDYHWKLDELGESMNIVVKSEVTHEIINVRVKTGTPSQLKVRTSRCSLKNEGSSSSLMDDSQYAIIILTALLVGLLIIYIVYLYAFQPTVNVNVGPDYSMQQSGRGSNQCAYVQYMRRNSMQSSGGSSSPPHIRGGSISNREPVYGDPSSFYATNTSRNNRSFM